MANYAFFQHTKCEFFPCHSGIKKEQFNCLFCYCPLYLYADCPGKYQMIGNIKDCSDCTWVHEKDNYKKIVKNIKSRY
ncbi:MAG: metal-binding protein [Eubacteriaceae bacterium]|nr:metal-binding protein [Eubacteriaceae bacterium]